jgi:putative transposase
MSDKQGAQFLLRSTRLKGIKKIWADSGYSGREFKEIAARHGKELEIVKRPSGKIRVYNEEWRAEWIPVERGFTILPRRWVVERTFSWIGRYRRMSKDYEYMTKTSKAMIYLSLLRSMLNRYAKAN